VRIKFVTGCTPSYDRKAVEVVRRLAYHDQNVVLVPFKDRGCWMANTRGKITCLFQAYDGRGIPVLWIDADTVPLRAVPEEDMETWARYFDICAPVNDKGTRNVFRSAILFVNDTPAAHAFLHRWMELCEGDTDSPGHSDEWYMEVARRETMGHVRWGVLGKEYSWLPRYSSTVREWEKPSEEIVFQAGLSKEGGIHAKQGVM